VKYYLSCSTRGIFAGLNAAGNTSSGNVAGTDKDDRTGLGRRSEADAAVETKSRCDTGAGRFGVRGVAAAEPLPPPSTTRRGVDGGSTHKRGFGLWRQHGVHSEDEEGLQSLLSAVRGELVRYDSLLKTLSSAYRSCAGAISHTDGTSDLSTGVHGRAQYPGARTGVEIILEIDVASV